MTDDVAILLQLSLIYHLIGPIDTSLAKLIECIKYLMQIGSYKCALLNKITEEQPILIGKPKFCTSIFGTRYWYYKGYFRSQMNHICTAMFNDFMFELHLHRTCYDSNSFHWISITDGEGHTIIAMYYRNVLMLHAFLQLLYY